MRIRYGEIFYSNRYIIGFKVSEKIFNFMYNNSNVNIRFI